LEDLRIYPPCEIGLLYSFRHPRASQRSHPANARRPALAPRRQNAAINSDYWSSLPAPRTVQSAAIAGRGGRLFRASFRSLPDYLFLRLPFNPVRATSISGKYSMSGPDRRP